MLQKPRGFEHEKIYQTKTYCSRVRPRIVKRWSASGCHDSDCSGGVVIWSIISNFVTMLQKKLITENQS